MRVSMRIENIKFYCFKDFFTSNAESARRQKILSSLTPVPFGCYLYPLSFRNFGTCFPVIVNTYSSKILGACRVDWFSWLAIQEARTGSEFWKIIFGDDGNNLEWEPFFGNNNITTNWGYAAKQNRMLLKTRLSELKSRGSIRDDRRASISRRYTKRTYPTPEVIMIQMLIHFIWRWYEAR